MATYVVSGSRAGGASVITDAQTGKTTMVSGLGAESDPNNNVSAAIAGRAGTGAAGTLRTSISPSTLTGVAGTGGVGTVTPSPRVSALGVSASSGVGSFIAGHLIPGVSATFAVNAPTSTVNASAILDGNAASFSVATTAMGVPLSGVDLYGTAGVISDDGDVDVPHANREVPGTGATFSVGSLIHASNASRTVPSVAITSSIGSFPHSVRYTLRGNAIASHVGTLTEVLSAGGLTIDDLLVTQYNLIDLDTYISLEWSDDKGETWGFPITRTLGQGGEYLTSVQWRRLGGNTRDRVFRISYTAPTETALTGIWYEMTDGSS